MDEKIDEEKNDVHNLYAKLLKAAVRDQRRGHPYIGFMGAMST